jgi:hypothetical protein
MIKHALNREWRMHELSKGKGSSHSITLFTSSNDVSDLSIYTSPMVMRKKKAILHLIPKCPSYECTI